MAKVYYTAEQKKRIDEINSRVIQLLGIGISSNIRLFFGWKPNIREIIQLVEYEVEADMLSAELSEIQRVKTEQKDHIDTII